MSLAFKHHVIDTGLQGGGYAQTALADLDSCGRPEFIVGRRGGGTLRLQVPRPRPLDMLLAGK
jgi:hypothetical protein